MTRVQTIAFAVALVLVEGVSVALLNAVEATQEVALLVVFTIAAVGGTLLGIFGERTEDEQAQGHTLGPHTRPHAS